MTKLDKAISELQSGKPILVYDSVGREEETDIVIAAEHATPEYVRMLRRDGGGLLCLALHPDIAEQPTRRRRDTEQLIPSQRERAGEIHHPDHRQQTDHPGGEAKGDEEQLDTFQEPGT